MFTTQIINWLEDNLEFVNTTEGSNGNICFCEGVFLSNRRRFRVEIEATRKGLVLYMFDYFSASQGYPVPTLQDIQDILIHTNWVKVLASAPSEEYYYVNAKYELDYSLTDYKPDKPNYLPVDLDAILEKGRAALLASAQNDQEDEEESDLLIDSNVFAVDSHFE
jgi:hypothetical protein